MRRTAALVATVLVLSACGQDDPGLATGIPPEPSPAAACPERFPAADGEPWVPEPPTTETPGRLVPDADPVEAVVCRYGDVFDVGSAPLDGGVVLQGGLDRIRTDLRVPPRVAGAERACTLIGGGFHPHLVRLRYADGELWLSAVQEPNGCSEAGNGAFVTSAYLGDLLAQAYDSRTWPSRDPDPCADGALGRAGQEQGLVPEGATALVACDDDGRREVDAARAAQVAALLRQLGTRPVTDACDGTPETVTRLVFTYAEGPPVTVRWTPGCEPSLGNGSLSATPTSAQGDQLAVLLR